MADVIAGLCVALLVGGALFYIIKERKKGVKCIGCPYAKNCSGGCGGNSSGCGSGEAKEKK